MTTMLKTEVRPAPLPARPAAAGGRVPPPEGAAGWAKVWLDADSLPQHSSYPVPVDADNRRTAHVRHLCRGKIEVTLDREDGRPPVKQVLPCDQAMWLLPDASKRYCPDHGCEMTADEESRARGSSPWGKVLKASKERLRVAGITAAVGVVGAVDDRADLPWWGDAAEFAAMPAVVWSSWWLTQWWLTREAVKGNQLDPDDQVAGKRRRRLIGRRARIAAYAATAAVSWERIADLTDWTSSSGTAVVGMAALAGLGVLCSRPYRAYVDASRTAAPAEQPQALVEQPTPAPSTPPGVAAANRWLDEEGKGAVLNTVLLPESYRKVVGGWGIIIRATKPGAVALDMLTDSSAKGRLRVIAGTFGINRKFFNFVEQDDPNDVLMLVQPNPPLAEAKVWAGPESIDVDKGVALTGYYIDGSPMYEPFYKYGWGAPSKIVTGTTGSGKSENLRKQLIIERYYAYADPNTGEKRGMFASFLQDFKQFESYGEFRQAVHAAGSTVEDAYIMRDALIREMWRRYKLLSSIRWVDKKGRQREGGVKWDPRAHGPILSWTFDEFHEIAKDKEFIGPLELLARKMRACGIRIVIGTHMGTLGDTGSRGFRDMLAGGYALYGRTTDSLTSVVTGGTLTADPRQLPKLPGMCLVADGEQQTMHARQSYIPADEDAPLNVYDLLFDDDNNPIGFPAELPPETLEAFGPEWVAWAEAGKQPGGRPDGKWASGSTAEAAEAATAGDTDISGAKDAVKAILLAGGGPMDIDAIDEALKPMRARGVKCSTSMARKVLRELVEKDKFAFKPTGHKFYQVAEHVQEDLLSQAAEAAEDAEK